MCDVLCYVACVSTSTQSAHTEILLLGRCVVEIERRFHEPNPDAGVTDALYVSATVGHRYTLGCPRRVLHTREHKWTPSVTHHASKYQPGCVLGGKLVQLGLPWRTESSGVVVATRASVHCTLRATHTRKLFTFKSTCKHPTSNVRLWLCSR